MLDKLGQFYLISIAQKGLTELSAICKQKCVGLQTTESNEKVTYKTV